MYRRPTEIQAEQVYGTLVRDVLAQLLEEKGLCGLAGMRMPTIEHAVVYDIVRVVYQEVEYTISVCIARVEVAYYWIDRETNYKSTPVVCANLYEALLALLAELDRAIDVHRLQTMQVWWQGLQVAA